MPGLEHQSDQPGDPGPDEVLDAGARRPFPGWVALAAVAIVALAVITVIRNNSAAHKQLTASGTPAPTVLPTLTPQPLPVGLQADSEVGPPIYAGRTLAASVAGETSWVLQPRALVSLVRGETQQRVPIPGPSLGNATARLVLDVPAGVLWVVTEGTSPARLLEFSVVRLRLIRDVHPPGEVTGAAAMDGHLLLTSGAQLFDFPAGKGRVTAASVEPILDGIVADPARRRLLIYGSGGNTQIWPVELTRHGHSIVGQPVVVALAKATMGVAQGSVWIAGFAADRPVLTRLNPRTLQPTTESPIESQLQPGAVIVATGVVVIWVRDNGGAHLRCIDAVTGDQLQAWTISGAVASGGTHGLVATAAGAVPLALSACSG